MLLPLLSISANFADQAIDECTEVVGGEYMYFEGPDTSFTEYIVVTKYLNCNEIPSVVIDDPKDQKKKRSLFQLLFGENDYPVSAKGSIRIYKEPVYYASNSVGSSANTLVPEATTVSVVFRDGSFYVDGEKADHAFWSCVKETFKNEVDCSGAIGCLTTLSPETIRCLIANCGVSLFRGLIKSLFGCW